jgi:arginine/lysine/ornithine decarboxylase
MLPREAFFSPREAVKATDAVGRISAEQVTPYPPGIPTLIPGERITEPVIDYLRSGVAAGMVIPDASDRSLGTFVVVA